MSPAAAPRVSVVIPARNAAETLAETLDSVRAQTFADWEVVVVENDSSDGTPEVAERAFAGDPRFHLIRRPAKGVNAARMAGIADARGEFLLLLDADDLIGPEQLATLVAALDATPDAALAYCGYIRLAPDGSMFDTTLWTASDDMFLAFSQLCAFAVHCALVRTSTVLEVGGLDPMLHTCEDWDLWQRIARTGARMVRVPKIMAVYRARPGSASNAGARLQEGGLKVLERAHGPDPRVGNPAPAFREGRPRSELGAKRVYFTAWCAALEIGAGGDGLDLLGPLADGPLDRVDPGGIAETLLRGAVLPRGGPLAAWPRIWPDVHQGTRTFCDGLEDLLGAPGLADAVVARLARLAEAGGSGIEPHRVFVDVAEPVADVHPPSHAERAVVTVTCGPEILGEVVLPAFGDVIPADVVADAIADDLGWLILGRWIDVALMPDLDLEEGTDGWTLRRGEVVVAQGPPAEDVAAAVRDAAAWPLLMQELWGRPDWSSDTFYDAAYRNGATGRREPQAGWLLVRAGEDVPAVVSEGPVDAVLTVAGHPVSAARVSPDSDGTVTGQAARAALLTEAGYEIARAVVRHGILGRPLDDGAPLRERVGAREAPRPSATPELRTAEAAPADPAVVASAVGGAGLVVARRAGVTGTAVSRPAVLPADLAPEIRAAAELDGTPVLPGGGGRHAPVRYAPDLLWRPQGRSVDAVLGRSDDEAGFDELYARSADPWQNDSAYERVKYEQTLAMVPGGPVDTALEVGCGSGWFSRLLAPRVGHLTAADYSPNALAHARMRLAALDNVAFRVVDLTRDSLGGPFDLVVCSEVLNILPGGRREMRAAIGRLAAAVARRGHLLMAHAEVAGDAPGEPGFLWGDHLGAAVVSELAGERGDLRLVEELRVPLYRIQLYRRAGRMRRGLPSAPRRRREAQPTGLAPRICRQVTWGAEREPEGPPPGEATDRLPVLMYHRAAPAGAERMRRWRVTPRELDAQMEWLRRRGYQSIELSEWRDAGTARRPLWGRPVVITFDDGYADFLDWAWPIVRRHGFSATLFVVTDRVGGTNAWDAAASGEEVPLLDWPHLRALAEDGVVLGSHTASHPRLADIAPVDAVRELARSRVEIARRTGATVDAVAYPYGSHDPAVRRLTAAAGYTYGFTCEVRRAEWGDPLLTLPRIEVEGGWDLERFSRAVEGAVAEPPPEGAA